MKNYSVCTGREMLSHETAGKTGNGFELLRNNEADEYFFGK